MAVGTPEEVATVTASYTGEVLRPLLDESAVAAARAGLAAGGSMADGAGTTPAKDGPGAVAAKGRKSVAATKAVTGAKAAKASTAKASNGTAKKAATKKAGTTGSARPRKAAAGTG